MEASRQAPSRVERVFPSLREPAFRLLWISTLPGMLAIQMGTVAVGYAAFVLSGSAAALGGVSLAVGVPMLALALVGGVVADRFPRRAILIATQMTLGVSAAAIAALAFADQLALWHLYVYGFAQGTAFSFNMPARQAFIAELVAPELMRSAINLNNATMNFGRIAGPPVAGALLAVPALGVGGVYAVIAAMYVFVLFALVRLPESQVVEQKPGHGGWQQLVAGLEYIRSRPPLLALLTLGFVPLFFGMPYQTLLPLFSERVHETGAIGLGLMNAAVGVGALAGSVVLAVGHRSGGLGKAQMLLGIGFGVGLVAFGLAPTFAIAMVALGFVGFAFAGYAAVNQTLVMEQTDREFHGRVMSVYLMSFGLLPLATFPQAFLADYIGGPTMVAIAGAVAAGAVVLTALLLPWYRRMG
jgi:MFS family permease